MIEIDRQLSMDARPDAVWNVLTRFMEIDRFAPEITSVDALSEGASGLGAQRRNHFANGSSLVEEVTDWQPGRGYVVELSELGSMPLKEAQAEIWITPEGEGSKVNWRFRFKPKYGALGWLMGQSLMRAMMGKIIDGNLKGLAAAARG